MCYVSPSSNSNIILACFPPDFHFLIGITAAGNNSIRIGEPDNMRLEHLTRGLGMIDQVLYIIVEGK